LLVQGHLPRVLVHRNPSSNIIWNIVASRQADRATAGGAVSYARDHLIPLVDEGLGNSAYLADLGDGRALAVDASRDLRALREAAAWRGLSVAFAADTHLHADFLTGSVQLAAGEGAVVLASAAGRREFPHTPLAD